MPLSGVRDLGAVFYLFKRHIRFVAETADQNHDKINDPSDAKYSSSDQPKNTGADFTDIEPMYTETAQKEAKQQGHDFALIWIVFSTGIVVSVLVYVGVRVVIVDDHLGLLGLFHFYLLHLLPAFGANNTVTINSLSTVLTELCVPLQGVAIGANLCVGRNFCSTFLTKHFILPLSIFTALPRLGYKTHFRAPYHQQLVGGAAFGQLGQKG